MLPSGCLELISIPVDDGEDGDADDINEDECTEDEEGTGEGSTRRSSSDIHSARNMYAAMLWLFACL